MDFKTTFQTFYTHQKDLKVISVASCDEKCKPNSASKMLISVVSPNHVYFLDYRFTQSYANIQKNNQLSISFMDDDDFTGYRLTGVAEVIKSGKEFESVKASWEKRLIHYEADRILKRITGKFSTREAENSMPKDFVIVKLTAKEASVIKPDRVFRAHHE